MAPRLLDGIPWCTCPSDLSMTSTGSRKRPILLTRWIARLLWLRRRKAQTTYDLLQLESVLRLTFTYVLTVFGPGLLLAYLGLSGTRAGDAALMEEVQTEARTSLDAALQRVDAIFDAFEEAARSRVERGMSTTESLLELSPYLLLTLRLDPSGNMAAPFRPADAEPAVDRSFLFSGPFAEARRAETLKDYPAALALYRTATSQARGYVVQGSARLHGARMLERVGLTREAELEYADIVADYANFRDPWGFPIGDLARLNRAEILLNRDPIIGQTALVAVVEDILNRRWEVGRGGEAAIARRALILLEGTEDQDVIYSLRNRLEERTAQLYWAERLTPELKDVTGKGVILKVAPGRFRYTPTQKALWATVWLQEDLLAFALDLNALQETVHRFARGASRPDGYIVVSMVRSEKAGFTDTLDRRSLSPWFPGASLVAHPRNPAALKATRSARRIRRFLMVGSSILLILVGSVMSVRMVRHEMELARMKTTFAASVSHELRSPITQIRLKGESLQLGLAVDDQDRQRHYDAIVREAERLSRLVDNVLDFAAIERGTKQYHLRPGDLIQTVENAVEAMRFSMESRGMTLEVDLTDDIPVIHHDSDAVAQVITNLLSNAAKYGGGYARVSNTLLPDGVQVEFQDRGIGIDPTEAEKIFEHFYRSKDPKARSSKGTGIGLAIVKYIMEAHGGDVTVRSTPGQGSVFQLFFPLTPPDKPGASDGAHSLRRRRS